MPYICVPCAHTHTNFSFFRNSNPQLVKDLQVVCAQLKCPVAKFSIKQNLKLLQWKPSIEDIVRTEAHIGLVASFGHLIPSRMISTFPM